MVVESPEIINMNSRADLDFFHIYNELYRDNEVNDDPYFGVDISSKFYDIESLANLGGKTAFLSINIQSLHSKHEQLLQEIEAIAHQKLNIDIIAIQETWDIQYPDLLTIPGFKPIIFKKRKGMRGGGVGFFVKNYLKAEIIEHLSPFENKIIEALTLQITYPNNKSVLVTSIYRSNGVLRNVTQAQQIERFMNSFDQLSSQLQLTKKESYIFLDSNIDLLSLRSAVSSNYLNLIFEKGYLQGIKKATRIQNESFSLIDQILFNSNVGSIYTGTLVSDVSDHFFTFICTPDRISTQQTHKTTVSRDYNHTNLLNFKTELGNADWNNVLLTNDIDQSYDLFWTTYKSLHDANFPLKRSRRNKNIHKNSKFMTAGLLTSRRTKMNLHKIAISDPTAANINRYKTFKTIYHRTVRGAKKLYITFKLNENASNPKKTWQTLNEILGKTKNSDKIDQINIDGIPEHDEQKIADTFNGFFSRVGTEISGSVPTVEKQPEEYINYNRPIPDLQLFNTTPEHVLKTIKKFQPKNSSDIQGVSTKMIKFIGAEICIPLSHIFNLSLTTGIFPSKLKQCRVIPIFKSGNQLECDNYRPISLLSSISKVLEKIVAEKLLHHLISNDLLYQHQYGFLPKKSTEHNLFHIVNYITKALNDSSFCIGVFLDLKKAFDVCSHKILLKKLKRMGINGTTYNWFKSYLSGRSQKVDINGCLSESLDLDISVIQGSILGPILFLCYINDFWTATTLFSVLFADDTTCLAKGKILSELTTYVNTELQKIANWFRSNKMAVNTSKTKFIVFRTRGKRINPQDCELLFNGNEIGKPDDPALIYPIDRIFCDGPTTSFKLLGILFDEYLSFEEHITSISAKIAKSLFCINRIKNFVTKSSLRTLYFSMIHSHLQYCINIYSCATPTALNKLTLIQKKAIRIISNANYRAHTAPLFTQLNILPVDMMIKYSTLKLMHSFYHNTMPTSFNETWITNRARIPERELRDADDLFIPHHKFATLKRLPLFTFPRVWNEEGASKNNPSQYRFLKNLKSSLLTSLTAVV
jgi:hypothetical protein